jgi:ankyrin repeat protein
VLHLALGDTKVNTDKAKMNLIVECIRVLRFHAADLNAPDCYGLCPIHYCAKTMNLPAAEYLLKYRVKFDALDLNGHTAMYYAAIDAHPDVSLVEALIKNGGGSLGKKDPPPLLTRASGSQRTVRTLIHNASTRVRR